MFLEERTGAGKNRVTSFGREKIHNHSKVKWKTHLTHPFLRRARDIHHNFVFPCTQVRVCLFHKHCLKIFRFTWTCKLRLPHSKLKNVFSHFFSGMFTRKVWNRLSLIKPSLIFALQKLFFFCTNKGIIISSKLVAPLFVFRRTRLGWKFPPDTWTLREVYNTYR